MFCEASPPSQRLQSLSTRLKDLLSLQQRRHFVLLRWTIVLVGLRRILPFLLLFVRQQLLLFRMFLLHLLRLPLMLLLN